jgi:putative hydroxymethylpyrimidine transport system substrate-binding protein
MGRRKTTRAGIAGLTLVAAIAIAGCGEREETTGAGGVIALDLALDFFVNPDHAGIYQAIENGHFEQAGLEVSPRVPSDPSAPIRQVAAGRVDLAISYEPEVLLARDQGLDVVAVAAIVPRPLTSLIALGEAKIEDARDLKGKTVATAGIPYQDTFMDAILAQAKVDPGTVKQVDVGFNLLPAVLSRRADAMLGGFLNVEGVDLEQRGKNPSVLPVDRLGVPTYDELVLVARSEDVSEDPEPIRLFLGALERGTRDAVADPEAATEAILAAGKGLDRKLTRAEVEETLPLLVPEGENRPYGFMVSGEWEEFIGFMADNGVIQQRFAVDEVSTNELLPGEIPD